MSSGDRPIEVGIRPWAEGDFALLMCLMTDPAMMAHLGGPEHPEQVAHRHQRYLEAKTGPNVAFAIVAGPEQCAVGWIGCWERHWHGEWVLETGWAVLLENQGQGIGSRAAQAVLEYARARGTHRWLHAFSAVDNAASNEICRRLGCTLVGEFDDEYPVGQHMRCNDWQIELIPG